MPNGLRDTTALLVLCALPNETPNARRDVEDPRGRRGCRCLWERISHGYGTSRQPTVVLEESCIIFGISSSTEGGIQVAKKTIRVSDMSGEEIPEGKGATVRITYKDARKGVRELDLTDSEAEKLGGRAVGRRGRKPKSTAA